MKTIKNAKQYGEMLALSRATIGRGLDCEEDSQTTYIPKVFANVLYRGSLHE
jgi:hypothetical protein